MEATLDVGSLLFSHINERGYSAEELAAQAVNKIIYVGDRSHPLLRDQAQAFKTQIQAVLVDTIKQAMNHDRVTIARRLRDAGHAELVALLKD
ncbi:hypothetical protein UFOVP228_83 [uncultured Caudovirales phage]|uniref:Uncharacterized protein n=1 Tax=uncultured Caudovirales phage TaxID=2100421 RepID=A0A6J7WTV1_9CAUD|nr:hypothetical protein UFOVP47_19 [uncultured Caudovirales phage]CAB5219524.1 hypothetical protein UFOVP228_83 [uncultured Caudovirales phage]